MNSAQNSNWPSLAAYQAILQLQKDQGVTQSNTNVNPNPNLSTAVQRPGLRHQASEQPQLAYQPAPVTMSASPSLVQPKPHRHANPSQAGAQSSNQQHSQPQIQSPSLTQSSQQPQIHPQMKALACTLMDRAAPQVMSGWKQATENVGIAMSDLYAKFQTSLATYKTKIAEVTKERDIGRSELQGMWEGNQWLLKETLKLRGEVATLKGRCEGLEVDKQALRALLETRGDMGPRNENMFNGAVAPSHEELVESVKDALGKDIQKSVESLVADAQEQRTLRLEAERKLAEIEQNAVILNSSAPSTLPRSPLRASRGYATPVSPAVPHLSSPYLAIQRTSSQIRSPVPEIQSDQNDSYLTSREVIDLTEDSPGEEQSLKRNFREAITAEITGDTEEGVKEEVANHEDELPTNKKRRVSEPHSGVSSDFDLEDSKAWNQEPKWDVKVEGLFAHDNDELGEVFEDVKEEGHDHDVEEGEIDELFDEVDKQINSPLPPTLTGFHALPQKPVFPMPPRPKPASTAKVHGTSTSYSAHRPGYRDK